MVKIFITGFRHSGTTMLMQLLNAHPQVGFIENEMSYIEYDKPKEWVMSLASHRVSDFKKYAWGEKIPWGTRDEDIGAIRPVKMIIKWLKIFKKDARVIHILRHPIDVALSGGRSYPGEKDWRFITTTVPIVIDFINTQKRCATVVYEDLVTNPKVHLSQIFDFLNLNTNEKIINKIINTPLKFGKINADRAYAFKNKQINIDFDYDEWTGKVKNKL